MRPRQAYTLYPVKKKNGKKTYYYRTYDESGKRTSGKSTHQTSKEAARRYVDVLLSKGLLRTEHDITFSEYAADWWVWGKCRYIQNVLATGGALSRDYADIARGYLTKHILPHFAQMKLSAIKAKHIEEWRRALRIEVGLSIATVNNIYSVLRKMLNEAERMDYLNKNPTERIKPYVVPKKNKGILTPVEAKRVLDASIWSNEVHYTANLLAAATGLRLGEVLGLRSEHVYETHIDIVHSLSRKYGVKETKTRNVRFAPIPSRVFDCLSNFKSRNAEGFVFSETGGERPVYYRSVTDALYRALEKIGISEEERRRRNISFHSWRHFFNSMLRGRGIADAKVRQVIGHNTLEMSERYTQFRIEDFKDVVRIQEDVF